MTRPMHASATGMERMRPVLFTVSPAFTFVESPKIIAPTIPSSRLRATPTISPGKSTISWLMTVTRPLTRATPSATESTVPTCSSWAPPENDASSARKISKMSVFFVAIFGLLKRSSSCRTPIRHPSFFLNALDPGSGPG